MKKKLIWSVASCLVVLSLVLVACAPKVPTEATPAAPKETAPIAPKEATPAAPKGTLVPAEEKPRYGGTIVASVVRDIGADWDYLYSVKAPGPPHNLIYEELLMQDWAKGPAGTKETPFTTSFYAPGGLELRAGRLAESWKIPDDQTLIFKIRQGVYWQDKPPVNGRQFTPEDAVFAIRYTYMNPAYPANTSTLAAPGGMKVTDVYIDPNDRWTVVVKVEGLASNFVEDISDKTYMYAPEVVAKYGSAKDWKNAVGTGPFILTDFVPGSSATLAKNPNWWLKDPVGPGKGNQLPYADGVKFLQIGDASTRVSALRTGKVDYDYELQWSDVKVLQAAKSQVIALPYHTTGGQSFHINLVSTDPLAAPLMNVRVRQAMAMAIDNEAIARDFYEGQAYLLRVLALPESPYYTPPSEMPEIVQKMFGYYPEEAKKILAEEGYPNGFKTQLVLTQAEVDLFSLVKEYLAKVGIDMELSVKESAVKSRLTAGRTTPAMATGGGNPSGLPEKWTHFGPGDPNLPRAGANLAGVNDPKVNDAINRSNAVYNDIAARSKIIKEIEPYIIEQAWYIILPTPYVFIGYQPWLKNNYGAYAVGYRDYYGAFAYAWVDQELKKKLGFK